jgi:hypothetical protein
MAYGRRDRTEASVSRVVASSERVERRCKTEETWDLISGEMIRNGFESVEMLLRSVSEIVHRRETYIWPKADSFDVM